MEQVLMYVTSLGDDDSVSDIPQAINEVSTRDVIFGQSLAEGIGIIASLNRCKHRSISGY